MTDLLYNLPAAFVLFFGLIFMLLGLVVAFMGGSTLRRWFASARWHGVAARVLSSEVRQERHFEDGDILFRPVVTYTFPVGSTTVTGHRLALAEKLYPSEKAARRIVERYPAGMVVIARYHPDYPAEAIIERRGLLASTLILLLGLAMIAVPLFALRHFGLPVGTMALSVGGIGLFFLMLQWWSGNRLRRARHAGLYPLPGEGSAEDVERLLRLDKRLLAIRLYRELHGTGLKEAREQVLKIEKELGKRWSSHG